MNSLFSILLKNIILLILIVVSLIFVFTNYIGFAEVKYVFFGIGSCYIIAACLEAYKLSQVKSTTKKFIYFTDGFVTKRVIKIISFACCGVVLYYSDSIIMYMSFLCFLIACTEIVVTLWRYAKHLCFVAFEGDTFIVSNNKLNTMPASDVAKIEARHGLTYFVDKKNNSFTVRTDMMEEKEEFKKHLETWIETNQLQDKVALL